VSIGGQRARGRDQPGLRRRVDDAARESLESLNRRDEDDAPTTALTHGRNRSLGAEERTAQVRVEHEVEVGLAHRLEVAVDADGCVGVHHVEAAER
jgi:hypothetical protein